MTLVTFRGTTDHRASRALYTTTLPMVAQHGRRLGWILSGFAVAIASWVLVVWEQSPIRPEFVVTTAICGFLIGVDGACWLLSRNNTFDPVGLVGMYGFFFFFVAPWYHVISQYEAKYLPPVADFQVAITHFNWVNIAGLIGYRVALSLWPLKMRREPLRASSLDRVRQSLWLLSGLSIAAYGFMVLKLGGFASFYSSLVNEGQAQGGQVLEGLGPIVVVSAWFPLALLALYLLTRVSRPTGSLWPILFVFLTFAIVLFIVAGLRGSRGAFVWPVIIGLGMIHYLAHPVRKTLLALAIPALVAFMFVYGIFKSAGVPGLVSATNGTSMLAVAGEYGRDIQGLVLGDFARTHTQALLAEASQNGPSLGLGMTYLGDVLEFLPGEALASVPSKMDLGTDAIYGAGAFQAGARSSLIYGLAGEGLLNFGWLGAAIPFAGLVILVRWSTKLQAHATYADQWGARLLAPAAAISPVYFVFNDLDNWVLFNLAYLAPAAIAARFSRAKAVIDGSAGASSGFPPPWAETNVP